MIRVVVGKSPSQFVPLSPSDAALRRGQSPASHIATTTEEIAWENVSIEELLSLASTPALFGGARIFLLIGAISSARGEEFLEYAKAFMQSPHTFVFEEEKLLKRPTDILTKAGAKIEKENPPAGGKERGFDPFGLTFALAKRDKKKLWLGILLALRSGEKPEALAGLLAWKARQMNNADLSRQLVWMYHDSHRGVGDLELLLERFALKL